MTGGGRADHEKALRAAEFAEASGVRATGEGPGGPVGERFANLGAAYLELRRLATRLVRKLDVALPQIQGMVAYTSMRAGSSKYDGPSLGEEVEEIRDALGLPTPAAEPHEFYPEGYCETCRGSGEVPGGEGIRTHLHRMNPDWPRSSWKDVCRDCRGTGGRGLPVPGVDYVDGRVVLATEVEEDERP